MSEQVNQSIWAQFDEQRAKQEKAAKKSEASGRKFRWVVDAILPVALALVVAVAVSLPQTLPTEARIALFAFALAAILWSTTSLNAAYVALAVTVLMILAGGSPQDKLFDALASDVIWLMIGAFVLGGAVQQTGLAERMTGIVIGRKRKVSSMFWLLTAALVPLSFFIPSTSGRAAVTIPVFRSIADAADDARITRALALLIPTIILVATISTLIGAGSHLIANDLLNQISNTRISFAQWAMWGVPFGVAASFISAWVIMWLFLDKERRERELEVPHRKKKAWQIAEWKTIVIAAVMMIFWVTESYHGIEIATVTVVGALLLTLPKFGVLSWKDGLKAVSWNLVIFVGAALVLGKALIETKAAQWLIEGIFELSGIAGADSHLVLLLALAFITLTSHIYMTSHAARAAALVPPILYLAGNLELNPVAVLFIGTIGMDYCLTFPVSSKALLLFQELDTDTFQPSDLLKLSSVLLIAHLLLIFAFYYGYWRWVGLAL
ncbi:MAG: SLC13 family permease [Pyrinomonadaceae bacterium MAG19_C2-C3]|nr:SLC13 family permease [Pyrinomonadaceae bacterium MAG19_C2-C3]